MNIVPVPREEPDDHKVDMRHEWLRMVWGTRQDHLQIDTVAALGKTWQDGTFELHLTALGPARNRLRRRATEPPGHRNRTAPNKLRLRWGYGVRGQDHARRNARR